MARVSRLMCGVWVAALLFTTVVFANAQEQHAFRVSFTDKAGSVPISSPLDFLSQRSLDRRSVQNLTVDATDQPVSPLYIDTVLNLTSGILHVTSKWMNDCVILVSDSADILALQGKPWISDIRYVAYYASGLHTITTTQKDADVMVPYKTTGSPAYYGGTWNQTEFLRGDCLHDASFRGAGKMIAIFDDGFNTVNTGAGFDSLNNDGRIKDVYNFVKANNGVYTNNNHGSQALSVMAAVMPDSFVGAAPIAQYALYVTEDQGSEQPIEMDNFVAALERADSAGVDVVSASVGYNTFDFPFDDLDTTDIDGKTTQAAKGVNFASAKGMLCVITAGNEGGNSWNKILTPGDADSALTVGNVNSGGVPAGNSGFGPNAAGVVKPDVVALGSPAIVLNSSGIPVGVLGTSFATPQIAGFAACLWQSVPWATASRVRQAIKETGSRWGSTPGQQIGWGIPDFCEALQVLDVPNVIKAKEQITVYPNPADKIVTVAIPASAKEASIYIVDVSGRILQTVQAQSGNSAIDIEQLPTGIYLVKVIADNYTATTRLVKY